MAESLKKMKKKKNKFKKNAGEANVKERKPKEFVKPVDMGNDGKKNKANGLNRPLVKHHEGQKWYSYQINEIINDPIKDTLATADLLALEEEADACLKADVELYNQHVRTQGGSEASWLLSVIKKGTASDRMTAMQLQMHTSPVHSLCYMEIMIGSLEKKNTRESLEILPILEEIFLNHFLPPDRKLVPFSGRPLKRIGEICSNSKDGRRRLLVLWRFEHKLKLVYERFLRAVEGLASLVVEDLSKRALRTALNLLAERPEGERFLLSMLVNKLGHPKTHIAAFVATLLEDLTKRQPRMRSVIVAEVERLIYRINVSPKAHMYASTFLSQITLRAEDSALAVQMLSIYFGLFKTLVCRKVPDNRLLVILLSAANRALPFAKEKADSLVEDINTLYKVVHTSSYSVALQTLKLLFQVHQISDSLSDRFYTALYRKLLIEVPPSCYNQMLLLVFKVLKADPSENRVRTFVKRLLQAATSATPSLAAGILILISRLLETRKNLIVLQKQVDRVALVDAKLRTTGDDDDEERYFDLGPDGKPITAVKKEEDEGEAEVADEVADEKKVDGVNGVNFVNKPGWIHRKHASKSATSPYNHGVRNPLFVDCSNLVDSELLLLSKHYHPSVAIFAKALIQDGCINYKGDPIEDFTLLKFLDRFAFKNPKENRSKDSSTSRVLRKKQFDPWGVKKLPVSSKEYISKKPSELPADEHYLHRFASLKFHPQEKEKKEEDDWEIESVDSAEFDAIIDKFEPGEANEEFDVDYTKEFTSEKKKPRAIKRTAGEEDGEDDEVDFELDDDEEDEGGEDDDEDDDDVEDDDEEVEMESDSDDVETGGRENKKKKADFGDSDDSDDEMVGNDANAAGEKFAALLEDFEEEETNATKKGKRKWKKSKALKRKRN
uniref:CBF domain-containing protein n=1 Tax=Haemonchus contortus TaxID=6289 RepID=A0A7I5ED95_HAECO